MPWPPGAQAHDASKGEGEEGDDEDQGGAQGRGADAEEEGGAAQREEGETGKRKYEGWIATAYGALPP